LLMFYYRPTAEYAYYDIVALREHVPLGIMREIHRWGAHAMVIAVWLHMFRVFMTGSYKPPREFNWVIGVILLVLTLLLSFTGYLLPWDQLAMWAITVGTNMARATPFMGYEGPGASMIKLEECIWSRAVPTFILPFWAAISFPRRRCFVFTCFIAWWFPSWRLL
jgi:quinol-cytochrome oxidoreductase complex cytochrome b subunit